MVQNIETSQIDRRYRLLATITAFLIIMKAYSLWSLMVSYSLMKSCILLFFIMIIKCYASGDYILKFSINDTASLPKLMGNFY